MKKGWKTVGVTLPGSVVDIITAAGGADPKNGGMPRAMASIIGALPWIAIALHQELPPDEYAAFASSVKSNMQDVWSIVGADDPQAAFDEACRAATRSLN